MKACQEGGIPAAQKLMKQMVAKASDKGMKTKCEECHKDHTNGDWTLTKDAADKFKKMTDLLK